MDVKSLVDTVKYILVNGLKGSKNYYLFLAGLSIIMVYGIYNWVFVQHAPIFLKSEYGGLIVTNLTDSVPWGIYIAFFIFWVGVAAAGIVFGLIAYVFNNESFKKVAILGEVQAIASIIIVLLLIIADMGQPLRALILMPQLPNLRSMLDWDFLVLTGYLLINIIGLLYTVHMYRQDKPLGKKFIIPFIIIAAPFAIGIHTVTAFISQALTARPIWHSPLLAPRYVATAFASGPALLLLVLLVAEKYMKGFRVDEDVYRKTMYVIVGSMIIGLYFSLSEAQELFWYTNEPWKKAQAELLFMGKGEPGYLVVLFAGWIILGTISVLLALIPKYRNSYWGRVVIASLVIVAVIFEKTMTIIVPAFIPDPLGRYVTYYPSPIEYAITIGIHALGLIIYAVLAKASLSVIVEHYGEKS